MSTPLFPWADALVDGKLLRILTKLRREGLSYEATARRLESDYGVVVTANTVRKWCREHDLVVVGAKTSWLWEPNEPFES